MTPSERSTKIIALFMSELLLICWAVQNTAFTFSYVAIWKLLDVITGDMGRVMPGDQGSRSC